MEHSTKVLVEIITIGDEILIGQIIDTNSAWMAVELNNVGFEIIQITSIHDNEDHIVDALNNALKRADIVLFTGGIGPTKDDITKQTLCKYFDTKLVLNNDVIANIEQLLKHRQSALNELTYAQAMVPEKCTVIMNKVGTAPITWFEKDDKIIVSMPGVPHEMKHAMQNEVINRLQKQFNTPQIIHKTLIVTGYPESALALKIADWENNLPQEIHLAYLPTYSIIRLRLSAFGNSTKNISFEIDKEILKLKTILGNAIILESDIKLEEAIGIELSKRKQTIATAESCTGGNIAHKLTEIHGSSAYYKGSIVAYDNQIKVNLLKVSTESIKQYGAVSKQVVEQMAYNIRQIMHADYGIATSGIAGPSGGTNDKPVGTVWIAISTATETTSKLYQFNNNRIQNIERATQAAMLDLLEKTNQQPH